MLLSPRAEHVMWPAPGSTILHAIGVGVFDSTRQAVACMRLMWVLVCLFERMCAAGAGWYCD